MYHPKHTRKIKVKDNENTPWYKKSWKIIACVFTIIVTLVLNTPTVLKNIRVLPEEVDTTWGDFISWFQEDKEWSGYYSSFPEGIIDIEDMELSDVDMKIILYAKRGEIGGSIYTKEICSSFPSLGFLQFSGDVTLTGNRADEVVVWDIVGGKIREFAKINIERDKDVITIKPISGNVGLFPENARLGKHPDIHPDIEEKEEPNEFKFSERCMEQVEKLRPRI